MASRGLSLKAVLRLESAQFKAGLRNVQAQLKSFGNYIKSAFALGGITAFGRSVVQMGGDFENAMARVKAVSNAGTKGFKMMRDEALHMGRTTKYTSIEAANSLEVLTRNGMNAAEATRALPQVLKMAQANAIGLDESANILTNTLNMFGLSVGESSRVSDVLSTTAAHTATNILELYSALVNAAPAAKTLGFSVEETAAALGALAQKGVKAEEAGTQLRMAFMKMVDPNINKKMQKFNLGINEAQMAEEGLLGTVERLKNAHLSFTNLTEIFSQKGAIGIARLISAYDDLDEALSYTTDAVGETDRMFEEGIGSTARQLAILKSKWQDMLITVQNKTSGVFHSAVSAAQNFVDNFRTGIGTILNIIPLVGIAVSKVIRGIISGMAALKAAGVTCVTAIKAAAGPLIAVLSTLVGLIGSQLYAAWDKVHGEIKRFTSEEARMQEETKSLDKEVGKLLNKLDNAEDPLKTLKKVTKEVTDLMPNMADQIRDAYRTAAETKDLKSGSEALNNYKKAILEAVEAQKILSSYQTAKLAEETYTGALGGKLTNNRNWNIADTNLWQPIKDKNLKGQKDIIYSKIAQILVKNDSAEKAGEQIADYLHGWGVEVSKKVATDFAKLTIDIEGDRHDIWKEARDRRAAAQGYEEQVDEIDRKNNRIRLEQEAREYNIKFDSKISDEDLEKLVNKAKHVSNGGGGDEDDDKSLNKALDKYIEQSTELKNSLDNGGISETKYTEEMRKLITTTWEAISAISGFRDQLKGLSSEKQDVAADVEKQGKDYVIDDTINEILEDVDAKFEEDAKELEKELKEGADKFTDALKEYLNKYDEGQEIINEKRDTSKDTEYASEVPYKSNISTDIVQSQIDFNTEKAEKLKSLIKDISEGLADGDFSGIETMMTSFLNKLIEQLKQAQGEASKLSKVLELEEAKRALEEAKDSLKDAVGDGLSSVAQGMDRFMSAIKDVGEHFGLDDDAFEGWEKFMDILNAEIQLMEIFKTISETVNAVQVAADAYKKKAAAEQIAANAAVIVSEKSKAAAETTAAAAGAGSAMAAIPVVGPTLAIAAIGAVLAAILATSSKFAEGGVVGGNSKHGDHVLAAVNSGEGILTADGLKNLETLYNNQKQGGVSGDVKFHISGKDLEGVLKNYNTIKKG